MMPNRFKSGSNGAVQEPPPCIDVQLQPSNQLACLESFSPHDVNRLLTRVKDQNLALESLDVSGQQDVSKRELSKVCRRLKPKFIQITSEQLHKLFPGREIRGLRLGETRIKLKAQQTAVTPDVEQVNWQTAFQAQSSRKVLKLIAHKFPLNATQAIATNLRSSSIRILSLHGNLNDTMIEPIIQALPSSGVISFTIDEGYGVTSISAVALANILSDCPLKVLDWDDTSVDDTGGIALGEALPGSQLIKFSLKNTEVGDQTAVAISQGLPDSKLRRLNLLNTKVASSGFAALAAAIPNSGLKSFSIGIDNEAYGMVSIFEALPSSNISEITLGVFDNPSAFALAKAISNKTMLKRIKIIQAAFGVFPANGVPILDALQYSSLEAISLGGIVESKNASDTLARVLPKSPIKQLEMSSGHLSIIALGLPGSKVVAFSFRNAYANDDDAKVLARILPDTPTIEELNLELNQITDIGFEAIIKILPKTNIKKLNLSYNQNSDTSMQQLAEIIDQTPIEELNLNSARMKQQSALIFAEKLPKSKVTAFNIEFNSEIGSTGLIAIVRAAGKFPLKYLNMEGCEGGDSLALEIAQILPTCDLEVLKIEGNEIQSVYALVDAIPKSKLKVFNFEGNYVPDAGMVQLAEALPQSNLTAASLGGYADSSVAVNAIVQNFAGSNMTTLSLDT